MKDLELKNLKTFNIEEGSSHLNISSPKSLPSVLIATPMYSGQCTGQYTISIINTINNLSVNNCETYLANITNESLITRARNELVRMFLEDSKCTHIMFIDADMQFSAEAVYKLVEHDEDVVGGLYPKKVINWNALQTAANQGIENIKSFAGDYVINFPHGVNTIQKNSKGLVKVRHAGTGFMLVKRKVFERLSNHVPTYRTCTKKDSRGDFLKPLTKQFFDTSIDETGALLSEDYHFCDLWNKHGGEVFVDLDVELKHVGTHVFEGNIADFNF
tara:strand:+ start:380 stop:1201 length:822 start_codon:yes stop_codon:yes gene_type:complete